jgi:hypothetical protein
LNKIYFKFLSNAGTYTKEEVIKVFKCKLSKLQLLYKKQLSIINDRLIYDRKKYLVKKETEKAEPMPTEKISLTSKEAELFKATKNYQAITQKVR